MLGGGPQLSREPHPCLMGAALVEDGQAGAGVTGEQQGAHAGGHGDRRHPNDFWRGLGIGQDVKTRSKGP